MEAVPEDFTGGRVDFDPSQADAVLAALFSHRPPITDVHRDAFRVLIPDELADELDKRTRAFEGLVSCRPS